MLDVVMVVMKAGEKVDVMVARSEHELVENLGVVLVAE